MMRTHIVLERDDDLKKREREHVKASTSCLIRVLNKYFLFLSKNFQIPKLMADLWTLNKGYLSFPN